VSGAVLVSPTDNGVLNQIPAGDGRESSREQVVPADGAPLLDFSLEAGRPLLLCGYIKGFGGRATSLTHKKKKKKKKKKVERSGGRGGVEVEVTHRQ